jgi:ankyrin repeat protein
MKPFDGKGLIDPHMERVTESHTAQTTPDTPDIDESEDKDEESKEELAPSSSTELVPVQDTARALQPAATEPAPKPTGFWGGRHTRKLFKAIRDGIHWWDTRSILDNKEIDFSYNSSNGDSLAAHLARYTKNDTIDHYVRHIIKRDPDALNRLGTNKTHPLETACEHYNAYAITAFLQHGASLDPNLVETHPTQILDRALQGNYGCLRNIADIIDPLCDAGADLFYTLPNGTHTLLEGIARSCPANALQKLAERGVDLHIKGHMNYSLLMHAAHNANSPETISYLAEYGIELDHVDNEGNTAAHHAAKQYNWEHVQRLVHAGANVDLLNHSHIAARDIALADTGDRSNQLKVILERTPMRNEALQQVVTAQDTGAPAPSQEKPSSQAEQWSYDGKHHVTCLAAEAGLKYRFNMAAKMVIINGIDANMADNSPLHIVPFADFAADADCYDPDFLDMAKKHYKPTP